MSHAVALAALLVWSVLVENPLVATPIASAQPARATPTAATDKVNINTATPEQLDTLLSSAEETERGVRDMEELLSLEQDSYLPGALDDADDIEAELQAGRQATPATPVQPPLASRLQKPATPNPPPPPGKKKLTH